MKYVRWLIAPVVITAGVMAAMLAGAADGDPVVEGTVAEVELTGAQRTSVRNFALSLWPSVDTLALERIYCQRRNGRAYCRGSELAVYTATEYAEMEGSGSLDFSPDPEDIAADGTTVSARKRLPNVRLSPSQATALATWADNVLGVSPGTIRSLSVRRDGATVYASARSLQVMTPVQRLLCLRNETCGSRLGTVGE
jgi:hypothetical protein